MTTPSAVPPSWVDKQAKTTERERDVVTIQMQGRVGMNEDICLTICEPFKQLRTDTVAENELQLQW